MATILVLHGPNLNLLGQREPGYYGQDNLETINQNLTARAGKLGHTLLIHQENSEHSLMEHIHNSNSVDLIIFNPAAFTHTSIALRDALLAVKTQFIEVHLSNIYQRESFRHTSYFSDIAIGVISGFGAQSYQLALSAADNFLTQQTT